jgi:hypothetical protein
MDEISIISRRAFEAAQSRLRAAYAQVRLLRQAEEYEDSGGDAHVARETAALERAVVDLQRTLEMALEALRFPRRLYDFKRSFEAKKFHYGRLENVEEEPDYRYSPAVEYLNAELSLIAPLFAPDDATRAQRATLFNILSQTNILIRDAKINATRELHVQNALRMVLPLSFPDCVPHPQIPKPTKTYIPDFGIASLRTLVELKFVDDPKKAKLVMGELFEDMKGYHGTSAWTFCFGVIYQTVSALTQAVVDAEAKIAGVPSDWTIILVTGHAGTPAHKTNK